MDGAFGAAIDEREEVAAALVCRGDDDARITRIELDVGDARVVADLEHLLPGLAAVRRLVEAAIAAGAPERPLRRHVHDVAVRRIDDDLADVLRGLEPDVLP